MLMDNELLLEYLTELKEFISEAVTSIEKTQANIQSTLARLEPILDRVIADERDKEAKEELRVLLVTFKSVANTTAYVRRFKNNRAIPVLRLIQQIQGLIEATEE